MLSDEEKKKREEEAKIIINNNRIGDTINSINYANSNNLKIDTQNEEEQNFINKVNEANNIINSINPRKNVSVPTSTVEDKIKSQQNVQKFIDLIDKDVAAENERQYANKTEITNINTFDTQIQTSQKSKAEIDEQIKNAQTQNVNPSNNKIQGIIDNDVTIGLTNPKKTQNTQELSMSDIKAMEEANQKNKNIEKGEVKAFNEWADTVLNNILGGAKQAVAGLANVLTTVTGLGIRGLEGASRIVGLNDIAKSLNQTYNNVIDTESDINEKANYEKTINSQVKNDFVKTSGDVSNVISNMIGNTVIGYATGISGTVVQGLSVGGSSSQEVLDENKDNIGQATLTGIAKGYVSYLTERMFDANILTRGSKKTSIQEGINRIIVNKINSKLGKEVANKTVGIIGENLEELAEDNAGYLIDKLINNKDLPDFEQWWNNTTETAKTTTLSTMIMGLLGLGGESFSDIEMDMKTEYWIDQAQQIIEQEDLAVHFNPSEVKNLNETKQFYITRFTQEGELANIVPTKGKTINNPRQELNITPVVVRDRETNFYNIIDGNTGVVLDNTYYATTMEAEGSFNEKANKLTDLQVKDINNKINEVNYLITDKIMNTINEAREQLIQNNINKNASNINILQDANTDISQTSSQKNIADLQSKKTSYTPQDVQKIVEPFNPQEEYTKNEMAKIWNEEINANDLDVLYDNNGNIQNYIAIEEDGNKIYTNLYDSNDNLIKSEVISSKNGKYTSEVITNAIEKVTDVYGKNRPIEKQVDIEGNMVQENKTNKSDEEIRNIVKYNQDGREIKDQNYIDFMVERYKDNINISNIETDTNYIERISNKTKKEKITDLYGKIKDKDFKITKKLYDENQQLVTRQIDLLITKSGLNESFNKGFSNEKYAIVPFLDDIIKTSQDGIIRNEAKQRENIDEWYYLYNTAKINDELYGIKIDIKKTGQGDRFYVHRVNLINKRGNSNLMRTPLEMEKSKNEFPTINNSIPQKTETVKNETVINNKSTQKKEKNTTKIEDFGEKIGGARKDLSTPRTNTKPGKEVIHDYTVQNTENGYSINFKNKVLKDGFKTQQEAEKYILDFKENIKSNRAFVEEGTNRDGEPRYSIYLRNTRTLRSQHTGKVFSNKQDAENYAMALSMYIKENGKNLFRPQIQKVDRVNSNSKNATKATGDDVLKNFGFKGGEFGNWVTQNERQQFLNYAQDAFTDLATALDITPESLGQKGAMSIAFGARGQGLTGAVAHFEPSKKVINMTRLKGAGSLAHEYGHSIDNYLSREGGYNEDGMATENLRNPKLSDNMQKAIKNVEDSIRYNISTNQEEIDKKNAIYEKGRKESLQTHLSYLDNVFNGNQTTYKYNRKTKQREKTLIKVTDKQKQKYQDIRKTLLNGELDSKRTFIGNSLSSNNYEYGETIESLKSLYKEVVGRKINDDTIYWLYRYGQPAQQVSQIKSESAFSKSAKELDKETGRTNAYFSRIDEMWARAFESYIYDKLKAKGITDTYLVHSVNNSDYALFNPFPAGEERENINKAFDTLIQTMKNEDLFNSTNGNKIRVDTNVRSIKMNNAVTTDNSDIRYMKNNKSQNAKNEEIYFFNKRTAKNNVTESTQRNAERQGSYIEQEIQKIEKTENWDDSIPVTKMTDIRKTIEDYLGLNIKKGRFRQDAYAIYKGNRHVIRTKEYKDMDSILHEAGHALDIGNRLNIDKESISNELLTAIDKLGGYEQETRTIRLEEGFAEVIREYSIVPDQAKLEYPQTVSIIEKIRQNDKSFNDFITKVQEQTYNYIHQNPRNRSLSNQSIGEQTDKIPLSKEWVKEKTIEHIFDKDYALKSAVSTLQKVNDKTINQLNASDNAYYITRLANGIGDKVTSMLSEGYIDENGNKLMPGLNQIGEIFEQEAIEKGLKGKPKQEAIKERFNDLRAYLVAQRDIEYRAKTLKTGIRTMDSKAVIEQFKNDVQIQQASKLVYDTLDGVMQYAVINSLISKETADKLKESNAFYVPMQRVLGNGNQVGRKGAVTDIIKKRTGSELDIKDVLENIIANTTNIVQQVENNNTLKALYKQGEEAGITGAVYDVIDAPMMKVGTAKLSTWETELKNQGVDTSKLDLQKTIDLFVPNNKVDTQNKITSFIDDNGKRIYLQFNDDVLFSSIMNLNTESTSMVLNICNKLNTPLRYGATMANLGFAIPNMISDTVQATIYSTAGFIPIVDNALGVLDILATTNKSVNSFVNKVAPEYANRINMMYALYQQSGASSGTRIAQERKSVQRLMKDIYGTNNSKNVGIKDNFKPLKGLFDLMTYIPEISEQSTRFEVFKKNYDYYKNKGNNEMNSRIMAALESRDATQDFSRMGRTMREVNKLIPFSAARVGSIYTFSEKIKANPKKTAMRIALLTTIAMAIKAMGYDDDEIEELNQRKKDDNFVFKVGDNVVTIKKPQGLLRSIINLTEYIQDLATGHIEEGKEGERLGEWLNNAIMDSFIADDVTGLSPNAITPLIENAVNKDFYYNTDIVKSYDLELPDKDQYYEYNSQLAILLGNIFNYSPAKIDNLISGYFGGLGTQVTGIIDNISTLMGLSPEKVDMGAESDTIGKRFIVNVNSNSASIDEIYTKKEELTKKKNGRTITEEETKELSTITEAVSNMSKLNKQIKEIKKDLSMSGKEKANEIKLLQQQRTDTARKALEKNLIHSSNASKIQSTQFYPTSQTLKQNGYALTLNSDMKKEYEKLANEYYSKYEKQGLYNEEKLKDLKSKSKDYAKKQLMQKYKNNLVKTKK